MGGTRSAFYRSHSLCAAMCSTDLPEVLMLLVGVLGDPLFDFRKHQERRFTVWGCASVWVLFEAQLWVCSWAFSDVCERCC